MEVSDLVTFGFLALLIGWCLMLFWATVRVVSREMAERERMRGNRRS